MDIRNLIVSQDVTIYAIDTVLSDQLLYGPQLDGNATSEIADPYLQIPGLQLRPSRN